MTSPISPWPTGRARRYRPRYPFPTQTGTPIRHQATTLVLATLSTLVLAAPSAVAVDARVGEDTTPTTPCPDGYTFFQTLSPGSSYAVPTDGVITSWTTRGGASAASSRTFKVGRVDGSSFSVVATSTAAVVPIGQLVTQQVRMPARAGDVLGLYTAGGGNASECATLTDSTYGYSYYVADVPPGPAPAGGDTSGGAKFNVTATVEPDADRDGYGDTTQDLCATQADTQGACRDTTAPQTRITRASTGALKGRATKAAVSVTFRANEAATFRCSVDGSAYKKCNSPLVRKLGAGRHVARVRAVDAAGNADASPAVARVTVKRR